MDSRQKSFPETIQLAISEQQMQRVLVISIRQTFPEVVKVWEVNGSEYYPIEDVDNWCMEHNLLLRLLANPKVELVGVGVAGDITRLRNHFPEAFVGTAGSHHLQDCAKLAEKYGLLFAKQKRSLSALVEYFLSLHLDKSLARSHWSSPNLPQELVNYAALDAWMGLRLYQHIMSLALVHRKPSKDDIQQQPYVRLLAARSNVVVAFAKVDNSTAAFREITGTQQNDLVTVNIVTIIDGSAKVPMRQRLQGNNSVTVADVHGSGQPVAWPRHRMMLSNECDIEHALRYMKKTKCTP